MTEMYPQSQFWIKSVQGFGAVERLSFDIILTTFFGAQNLYNIDFWPIT